jgi:hypothetical protein
MGNNKNKAKKEISMQANQVNPNVSVRNFRTLNGLIFLTKV